MRVRSILTPHRNAARYTLKMPSTPVPSAPVPSTSDLFDPTDLPDALQALLDVPQPWEVLARLDAFLQGFGDQRAGTVHPTAVVSGALYLHETATVGPHTLLEGPVWLGAGATVKHGAYLRGPVVLAPGAVVGPKTEVKRSLFLPHAKAAHLNYVGDSVLGTNVNLGAGVKLANFKTFGDEIRVGGVATGLRKFGAALGDHVSVGCNAVTAPGTVVGARSLVYSGATLRGVLPADVVVKVTSNIEIVPRR